MLNHSLVKHHHTTLIKEEVATKVDSTAQAVKNKTEVVKMTNSETNSTIQI
jgi:hypothetical protein